MFSDRYDWVVQQIDAVAEAARKVAETLAGKEPEQLIEIDEQTDSLLEDAFEHSRIQLVDSRTAAMILRPPSRIRAYARILAQKSRLVHELGRDEDSLRLARRALELQLEAAALEPDLDKIDYEAIEALLDRDPPLPLGPRQRALLDELDQR